MTGKPLSYQPLSWYSSSMLARDPVAVRLPADR